MIPRCYTNILTWRTVFILALIALILQVINYILSWHIQQKERTPVRLFADHLDDLNSDAQSKVYNQHQFYLGDKVSLEHEAVLGKVAKESVLDSSGEFRISIKALLPLNKYESIDDDSNGEPIPGVTLVTQCSLSQLKNLPLLVERWNGPVSASVFTLSGEVQAAVQLFLQLQRCYPSIRENVTFHLVFPLNSPTSPHITPTKDSTPCNLIFSAQYRSNYDFGGIQYPNNLLRNIAIKTVQTNYMFLLDIDMVPSFGLQNSFMNFYKKNIKGNAVNDKTAYVVPAYEIMTGIDIPKSKEELMNLRNEEKVQPFYKELCWKCQKHTDYSSWEKAIKPKISDQSAQGYLSLGNFLNPPQMKDIPKLNVLHEVLWKDPWEPFYICHRDVPLYDERFRQYGFNRISQVCELHVAGYKFAVLDSAFLVHKGFKTKENFHTNKDLEQERNRILFRQFKIDLKNKYPDSSRRCY